MKKALVLVACLACLFGGVAQAATLTYNGVSPYLTYTIYADTLGWVGGAEAGVYHFAIGDSPYAGTYSGFCVEPQYSGNSANATIIDIANGSRYEAAAYLMDKYYYPAITATEAAILQVAIWESVWDSGSAYDLASGKFQIQSFPYGAQVSAYLTEATGALATFNPSAYHVVQAGLNYNANPQDFMFRQVPEPGTLLLLGAGLLGLVGVGRKFRK